jgi:hypothetical protein
MAAVMVVAAEAADLTAVVVAEADFTVAVAEVVITAEVVLRRTTPGADHTEDQEDTRRAAGRDTAARAEWAEAERERLRQPGHVSALRPWAAAQAARE